MRLGITGDLHSDMSFKIIYKARKLGFTHLIVCGDFGYIWNGSRQEQKQLDFISKIGITILFCDGNHENHKLLNEYNVTEMYGGKVHEIRPNIIHLMRGEIYVILGNKYFVFGGASSTDLVYYNMYGKKKHRIEGKDWWAEEAPSQEQIKNAQHNLRKHSHKVDYIITHTCHSEGLFELKGHARLDSTSKFLDTVKESTKFKHWYFGHMHKNYITMNRDSTCIFNDIIEI